VSRNAGPLTVDASRRVTVLRSFKARSHRAATELNEPGIEPVQALADITRSALCCHSNENRAPIANPPNCAQPGAPRTIPQVTSGSVQ